MKQKQILLIIAIMLTMPLLRAQDYSVFLKEAQEWLDKGDCEKARMSYDDYKEFVGTDPTMEQRIKKCFDKEKKDLNIIEYVVNGIAFRMIKVEGGTFNMGATLEQGDQAEEDEMPVHRVKLNTYYIGETEVTQALWQAVMESEVSCIDEYGLDWQSDEYVKGSNYPACCINWYDCQEFLYKLNDLLNERFRLPTEAEWEFAARGGNKSKNYKYAGSNDIDEVVCYDNRVENELKTHPIKTKLPNELGLYDMCGNVWEWCSDYYDKNYYAVSPSSNPTGPTNRSHNHVLRGGSYYNDPEYCRVSNRGYGGLGHASNHGFRLVLVK